MFGGTVLDTSLSSIGETLATDLDRALDDADQLTTTYGGGSITSLDNRQFEQELKNLDDNIAMLQMKLRGDTFSQSSVSLE